eukprot:c16935_g1_i2 orf=1102-3312(+)
MMIKILCRAAKVGWIYFALAVLQLLPTVGATASQLRTHLEADCYSVNEFLSNSRLLDDVTSRTLPQNCCELPDHVKCNSESVLELDFRGLGLEGTLDNKATIWNLKNLTRLDLSNNRLNSTIPSVVWHLPNLLYLNMSVNQFHGPAFLRTNSSIQSKGKLQTVDLSVNNFTGSLPSFCERFQNLTTVNVSFNRFTRFGKTFGDCTSLLVFDASVNQLQGRLPADISNLHKLNNLVVSHNYLDGRIPDFSNLVDLQVLDVSFNNLSGKLPTAISSLPKLWHLNVSGNDLQGVIDQSTWKRFGLSAFEHNPELQLGNYNSSQGAPPSRLSHRNSVFSSSTPRIGTAAISGLVGGSSLSVASILVVLFIYRRRKRMRWLVKKPPCPHDSHKHNSEMGPFSFETDSGTWVANVKDPSSVPVMIFEKPLLNLTFADLLQATSSFDTLTEVGEGAGLVYRCMLPGVLPGDEKVVIKVLIEGRTLKNEEAMERFETAGKIKHPNVVPFLGYCIVGEERLVIYKFMQNGNLYDWLYAMPDGNMNTEDWSLDTWEQKMGEEPSANMGWATRYKIVLGTARALAFLHHACSVQIIHGNISSTTILMDENFEPHLSDCGLTRLTIACSRSRRTNWHMPPEYGHAGEVTVKGDVYNFGIVLLELVTGKRPLGDYYPDHNCNCLVLWVRCLMKEKRGIKALDPKLVNKGPITEMLEVLRIGYLCTAESPAKRPTMQQVVGLVKDIVPSN